LDFRFWILECGLRIADWQSCARRVSFPRKRRRHSRALLAGIQQAKAFTLQSTFSIPSRALMVLQLVSFNDDNETWWTLQYPRGH
jgi:hypothetical protein